MSIKEHDLLDYAAQGYNRVPLVPNIGIIVGEEGVLVVDTGMGPANAEIVLSKVREITDLPIRIPRSAAI